MNLFRLLVPALCALCLAGVPARAALITQDASIALTDSALSPLNTADQLELPGLYVEQQLRFMGFDSSLGILRQVSVQMSFHYRYALAASVAGPGILNLYSIDEGLSVQLPSAGFPLSYFSRITGGAQVRCAEPPYLCYDLDVVEGDYLNTVVFSAPTDLLPYLLGGDVDFSVFLDLPINLWTVLDGSDDASTRFGAAADLGLSGTLSLQYQYDAFSVAEPPVLALLGLALVIGLVRRRGLGSA